MWPIFRLLRCTGPKGDSCQGTIARDLWFKKGKYWPGLVDQMGEMGARNKQGFSLLRAGLPVRCCSEVCFGVYFTSQLA